MKPEPHSLSQKRRLAVQCPDTAKQALKGHLEWEAGIQFKKAKAFDELLSSIRERLHELNQEFTPGERRSMPEVTGLQQLLNQAETDMK